MSTNARLEGYQTTVTMAEATLIQPCRRHHVDGWQERAVRALTEGWPVDGYTGGPADPSCEDCAAMPALAYEWVVGYHTNDPRVVGVNERGEAVDARGLDPNQPDQEAAP